jgi:hypothetical protein
MTDQQQGEKAYIPFKATLTGDMNTRCTSTLPARHNPLANAFPTDLSTSIVYWPIVEFSLGIVGACHPSMRPIFTKGFETSLRSMLSPSSLWKRSRSGSKESPKIAEGLESNRSDSSMQDSTYRSVKALKVGQRQYFPD